MRLDIAEAFGKSCFKDTVKLAYVTLEFIDGYLNKFAASNC